MKLLNFSAIVVYNLVLKGRVQYFLMQVVINKCFLLNPKKKLAQIRLVVFEKNTKTHTNSEK